VTPAPFPEVYSMSEYSRTPGPSENLSTAVGSGSPFTMEEKALLQAVKTRPRRFTQNDPQFAAMLKLLGEGKLAGELVSLEISKKR